MVSELGFGCAPLGDLYGAMDDSAAIRLVHAAIDAGMTLFDTAPYYGTTLSEERLGRALESHRDGVILATKCARHTQDDFDFTADGVRRDLQASLRRLRTDRIDLYHVHDVEFGDESFIIEETLPALMQMKEQGDVLAIGVSGLSLPMLGRIAAAFPLDSILSYCHLNLLARDLLPALGELTERDGIGLINASITHMGILTPQGPQPWHPAPPEVFAAGTRIRELCAERDLNIADVALRFAIDQPLTDSILIGVATEEQLASSLSVLDTENPPDLMQAIDASLGDEIDLRWHEGLPENFA
jgi:L-galactose dehydrogenase